MNSGPAFDVVVVGGGPAGIAAAVCAAENRLQVALVDENAFLGGQIWRRAAVDEWLPEPAKWVERLRKANVSVLCRTRVVQRLSDHALLVENDDEHGELHYSKLIIATGARERFLPFPGWTLPNVVGVGGLQAFVKSGLPIVNKRVVVAGSGPLLLAVAAFLRKKGAEIPLICEQASWRSLSRFGAALLYQPVKLIQAFTLHRELAGIPFTANSWVLAAKGKTALESVAILRHGNVENVHCDYLACGFHLVPNVELAMLFGCQMEKGYVQVDNLQQTSVSTIFCVGEPTGIGGVEMAVVQGEIAGFVVAGRIEQAKQLASKRKRLTKFTLAMERTFRLRDELRGLVKEDTFVCRCEDVPHRRLNAQHSWRQAKLQTRCGMGACQGRVCGSAAAFLYDWSFDSVRPPIFPARVESLATLDSVSEGVPASAQR